MAILLVGVGVAGPNWAVAQSAADRATARQLATDGIQMFRQERFADALDKLERAQSLFDAPVHLLYIARCQAKLNRLVEAAEAYRRLIRVELSAQAPQTFKDAVSDAQKELPGIEPKVPSLRVEVLPSTAKDLHLTIDGEVVSTAVLGVDRPINPGSHIIEVSSKGQPPVSRRVEVPPSSKQVVKLELPTSSASGVGTGAPSAGGGDAATEGTSGAVAAGGTSQTNQAAGASGTKADSGLRGAAAKDESRQLKLVAGVDIAGVLPFAGKIDSQAGAGEADNRSISGRYGPGGGLELRAGLAIPASKIAITPLLFVSANSHSPGSLYQASADRSYGHTRFADSVMTAKPMSVSIGLGLRVDTAPQQSFDLGAFGELAFVARQAYSTTGDWTVIRSTTVQTQSGETTIPAGKCDFTEEFNGLGFRSRAGVMMPVSRLFTLVGAAGVTVAKINSAGMTSKSCDPIALAAFFHEVPKATVPAEDRTYHAVLGLSLGAEFGLRLGR